MSHMYFQIGCSTMLPKSTCPNMCSYKPIKANTEIHIGICSKTWKLELTDGVSIHYHSLNCSFFSRSKYLKLVEAYHKRFLFVIAAKYGSGKYWLLEMGEYLCIQEHCYSNMCLSNNKIYSKPSRCAFGVDQIVRWPFTSIWIQIGDTTKYEILQGMRIFFAGC